MRLRLRPRVPGRAAGRLVRRPGPTPIGSIRFRAAGPILLLERPRAAHAGRGGPRSVPAAGLIVPPRTRLPHHLRLPPTVGGAPPGLLRSGDRLLLDGRSGRLTLESVREIPVVTCFLVRADGRLLLGRRSRRVGSFSGRWAAISGHLESEPVAQAYREIGEETGLDPATVRLERAGPALFARSGRRAYRVHPFRFRVLGAAAVRRDWEHTEFRWVRPEALAELPTVPRLPAAWESVAGPPPRPPRER